MKNQTPDDRFDEKAKKVVSKGGFLADIDDDYEAVDFDTDAIKHFLHSEIDLAVEKNECEWCLAITHLPNEARMKVLNTSIIRKLKSN